VLKAGDRLGPVRHSRPASATHLGLWAEAFTGVRVASARVCRDHTPPAAWLWHLWHDRPDLCLVLGSRGSGKSFLTGLATHLDSRFTPGHATQILGGSKAQSAQIFEALSRLVADGHGPGGSDRDTLRRLTKERALYRNGSTVRVLAASNKSVRGPHVPTLRLDEVDEIDGEIRQGAMGMVMARPGCRASVSMTSTWHRVGGPMTGLVEAGRSGAFPLWTTCAFEVLERCGPERSGPFVGGEAVYENCPACPLKRWCHAERDRNGGVPLAKLSAGHYAIDSLVQKVRSVSARVFEADYLCAGPRADGAWFTTYEPGVHVCPTAEFDPALPVHLSVDSGVFTGAVFFQVRRAPNGDASVNVFADYLREGVAAEAVAAELLDLARSLCDGRLDRVSTDSAGGARNPVGPSVIEEYRRRGLRGQRGGDGIERWPVGPPADSLALVEGLLRSADGTVWLKIHPRCESLRQALRDYRRARRGGQWQDYPEDPQHPAEDLVDALRGGLKVELPDGRRVPPALKPRPLSRVFY
jgi:hypothetical protein